MKSPESNTKQTSWCAGIDTRDLELRLGDDRQFLVGLLQGFVEDTSQLTEEVREPTDEPMREKLRHRLHRLSGSSANLSALEVAKASRALERWCEGSSSASFSTLAEQLQDTMDELRRGVAQLDPALSGQEPDSCPRPTQRKLLGALREILQLAEQRDIGALRAFDRSRDSLSGALPDREFNQLRNGIDSIDLRSVAQIIPAIIAQLEAKSFR